MLYIVPTPVGNLEDITLRALRILREVRLVLCEDTRQTRKLLNHYQISNQLQAYHKFNERRSCELIINQLSTGIDIALVSDGGTPCISDPGYILVEACMEAGIQVQCLPGATAFVPALVASGFDTSSFVFEGFLPHKKGRETLFKKFAQEERTIILYESPYRVIKTLEQIQQFIGDQRLISITREISKMYEETVRGTSPELLEHFKKKEPRGEFVIILGPTSVKEREEED
ncbi:MAG: 16S rRNA (cytidine(1402)-2'-O)-methyltransferase [Bacteroidetes bacterium]|nr:16S rRNA (cytidine(1402)-2'-O)-methyltransferase [Bacteroidota bacterium]